MGSTKEYCRHVSVYSQDAEDYKPHDEVKCSKCGLTFIVTLDEWGGEKYFFPTNPER